jgi:hypothetical protein
MITRVDGWQSSDGKIFKTEAEANDQEQYLTVYKAVKDMVNNRFHDGGHAHACGYIMAMNRKELYQILKDNV